MEHPKTPQRPPSTIQGVPGTPSKKTPDRKTQNVIKAHIRELEQQLKNNLSKEERDILNVKLDAYKQRLDLVTSISKVEEMLTRNPKNETLRVQLNELYDQDTKLKSRLRFSLGRDYSRIILRKIETTPVETPLVDYFFALNSLGSMLEYEDTATIYGINGSLPKMVSFVSSILIRVGI